MTVAVLFARADSVHKALPGVDVYDESRDARTFNGGDPVIAHPPCRSWGRLRHFAKPAPHERELAHLGVLHVRMNGGVLEHPAASTLWDEANLPRTGRDAWGGWTLYVDQSWFGHRAPKRTALYVVGVEPRHVPAFALRLGTAPGRVENMGRNEREATPLAFALFLLNLAARAAA